VFFCASEAHGHAIYDVFSLAIKTTVFTVCFGQRPAKTLVFEQFSACCNKHLLVQKGQKM
jgi:hypothetical protein